MLQLEKAHTNGVPVGDLQLVCEFLPVGLSRHLGGTSNVKCLETQRFGIEQPEDSVELRDETIGGNDATPS